MSAVRTYVSPALSLTGATAAAGEGVSANDATAARARVRSEALP
jgi:hypothetical protein